MWFLTQEVHFWAYVQRIIEYFHTDVVYSKKLKMPLVSNRKELSQSMFLFAFIMLFNSFHACISVTVLFLVGLYLVLGIEPGLHTCSACALPLSYIPSLQHDFFS